MLAVAAGSPSATRPGTSARVARSSWAAPCRTGSTTSPSGWSCSSSSGRRGLPGLTALQPWARPPAAEPRGARGPAPSRARPRRAGRRRTRPCRPRRTAPGGPPRHPAPRRRSRAGAAAGTGTGLSAGWSAAPPAVGDSVAHSTAPAPARAENVSSTCHDGCWDSTTSGHGRAARRPAGRQPAVVALDALVGTRNRTPPEPLPERRQRPGQPGDGSSPGRRTGRGRSRRAGP